MLGQRRGGVALCQPAMRVRRLWDHRANPIARVTRRQAAMSTDTPSHTDIQADHPEPELTAATVLIIEDNPGNRELAEQMLHVAGYRYLSTTTVDDGWKLLQRGGVDLVVTDLHVNAIALIERMRAKPETTDIPVVVASGSRGREVQQAAIDAGAAYYLIKPFRYEDLISTVERCLKGKEA